MDNENNNNNNNNNDDEIEDLDLSWINEFEKIDNEYKIYYTEELSFVRIHSIYVNKDNEIEKIREEKILLKNPGILQKEELLSIVKHNSFSNQVKYSLLSILKFNINLEPINLKTFLRNKNPAIGGPFLQSIKNLDTIKFEKSITMFHDINELLIIFHQKINKISRTNPESKEINNRTKKVFINSNPKKRTKRKELKETSP
jgi:hypothetical protein